MSIPSTVPFVLAATLAHPSHESINCNARTLATCCADMVNHSVGHTHHRLGCSESQPSRVSLRASARYHTIDAPPTLPRVHILTTNLSHRYRIIAVSEDAGRALRVGQTLYETQYRGIVASWDILGADLNRLGSAHARYLGTSPRPTLRALARATP